MAYNDINTGRKSAISTTAVQLTTDTTLVAENSVLIVADSSNAVNVWVGGSGLTVDAADTTDGFPLEPGDSINIPIKQPTQIYLRAPSGSNKVWWILV